MASFVTEVLASSGKLEKEDLASKISRMSRKVEDTKCDGGLQQSITGEEVCRCCHPSRKGPKAFHKIELVLSDACIKDFEPKPTPLLCSVLQALAIQGDLQNKIKLFSKNKQLQPFQVFCYSDLSLYISSRVFNQNKLVGVFWIC
ncbi:hypothetical protein GOODEAATRI_029527 [Goodea atripinnis]|uniref:Uncharacterized protein n=1 Tax=Goodea atripinnis TaxID=208336 RepID=A0ABV0PSN7_9TELE